MVLLMKQADATNRQSGASPGDEGTADHPPQPGLVSVFSGAQPVWSILPVSESELVLGREQLASHVQDGRISRRHVKIHCKDQRLFAMDLGSLNGTSIDGRAAPPDVYQPVERCLRIGDTIFLFSADVRRLSSSGPVAQGKRIVGPALLRLYQTIARFANASNTLHIHGESGVGKEDAARTFHLSGPKETGPFIAVNCANIPESIAERLLFGTRRGAFSGATADAEGYVQAADGGTLFLDEVAELHSEVQAKLLRVLENREVQALGAVKARPVDLRVCSASHASLRGAVAAGRLREDLYYRIGRPEISIPPLRERPEEIPWLIQSELSKLANAPRLHYSFVEACLMRFWPGNIRELLVEVRAAAQEAIADGSPRLEARHLSAAAGQNIKPQTGEPIPLPPSASVAPIPPLPAPPLPAPPPSPTKGASPSPGPQTESEIQKQEIVALLQRTGGNISKAARAMNLHRTAFRRLMERHKIVVKRAEEIVAVEDDS